MRFPRQEYWRGLPFPSPGDLPNPGIKPASPVNGLEKCRRHTGLYHQWGIRTSKTPALLLALDMGFPGGSVRSLGQGGLLE